MKEGYAIMSTNKKANRLIHEKSPYLLQHAYNPVDWYPWGDEAFQKARSEDKPIFLSIGYSTCHWCHVMEKESFEDQEVADILNKNFVSIKVDREERPDIDHIYMTACQALSGYGGWPMTIFMTPDKKPFYAATYLPKNDRMGMPGLISILDMISEAWKNKRESLLNTGNKIVRFLEEQNEYDDTFGIDYETIHDSYSAFKYAYDKIYGGFGSEPKFPTPHNLSFLLRYWHATKEEFALEMVEETLMSMYKGGIFDHIGFGFSRYSTDKKWLVPHFEKMLYDNALLAIAYLETYQATGKQEYAKVAESIFAYVLRDMTSTEGGFYSAEDADSEGEEGRFYLWTPDEVISVLGKEEGKKFCKYYDITPEGNFEGKNIPNLLGGIIPENDIEFVEKARGKLFAEREKRVHPHKDDKILTGWNGLMIAAMAIGGRTLGNEWYTKAAEKAAEFIFSKLIREDGRLMARYREGEAAFPAYADDYAFMIWGLIELYETTYKPEYLKKAVKLNEDLIKYFWDEENGGLYVYGSDSEQLLTRPKEAYDGATPSANSVSAMNFLRLSHLTGNHHLEELAQKVFELFGSDIERMPTGHASFLSAFLFSQSQVRDIVIVDENKSRNAELMINELRKGFKPFTVSMLYTKEYRELSDIAPFIETYKPIDGKATAYVCENYSCQPPVTDVEKLKEML